MNNELTKKKNDLLKSIMENPKLAKTFKEALSAPIGSTKRAQAKSVLSIMKKVGGVNGDGRGGPITGSPQNNTPATTNYSNMMIFPAAPRFKKRVNPVSTPTPNSSSNDGQGGEYNFDFTNPGSSDNFFSNLNQQKTYEAPTSTPFVNPFKGLGTAITNGMGDYIGTPILNTYDAVTSLNPFAPAPKLQFKGALSPYGTMANSTPVVAGYYGTPAKDSSTFANGIFSPSSTTVTPDGKIVTNNQTGGSTGIPSVDDYNKKFMAENPQYQYNTGASDSSDPTKDSSSSKGPTGSVLSSVQKAIDEGVGPTGFAMDFANEKFGGGLDQYITNLDAKLKKDFNLAPLETELTNLKSQGANLVPTLQTFMKGKDQYLSFIDSMIQQTEGSLLRTDMGNPATASSYNNYLNYLYTLKGRQNQRYGNFLNSAISDYNADLTKVQSNYDTTYKNYEDAMNRQGTMAQNEYNNLMTRMASVYTELENAPTKKLNLEILQQQKDSNALALAQNGINQSQSTNPKYLEDVKKYGEFIADKDGNLSTDLLGANGLLGFFEKINYQGGDPQAAVDAVNRAMATAIMNDTGGGLSTINKFQNLITDLSSTEEGAQLAAYITPSLSKAAYPIMSSYVQSNLGSVKNATKSLLKGGFWGGKSGLEDKEGWKKANSGLDSNFLDSLYNMVKTNITPGSAYQKNPDSFISALFTGANDSEIAKNVTSSVMSQ